MTIYDKHNTAGKTATKEFEITHQTNQVIKKGEKARYAQMNDT